ncbi:MAG: indole-3-glycerol phosphate synthase TrpC [Parvibaculales bacterium]
MAPPEDDILARITAYKLEEIAAAKQTAPLAALRNEAQNAPPVRGFANALTRIAAQNKPALIAEIKKASPSKGLIRADFDPPVLARAYEHGGAACLSVLTDAPSFQGAPEFLSAARAATALPVLRKDFMYDPYQVVEARAWGADAILIIMAAVTDAQATELADAAAEWNMDVLYEVHNEEEMARLHAVSPRLVGINNRDLHSFETSLDTTRTLRTSAPAGAFLISESGIGAHSDIAGLMADGVSGFLVGESLMRQKDVTAATRTLLGI